MLISASLFCGMGPCSERWSVRRILKDLTAKSAECLGAARSMPRVLSCGDQSALRRINGGLDCVVVDESLIVGHGAAPAGNRSTTGKAPTTAGQQPQIPSEEKDNPLSSMLRKLRNKET